jgi:hypothetical protein
MNRPDLSALAYLRARRADAALIQRGQAKRHSAEAGRVLDEAASALDAAEGRRAVRRQAIHASMADRPLSAQDILNVRDGVHAIAREAEADRARVLRLAEDRSRADRAAHEASARHQERVRAAEKARSIQDRLADRSTRRDEIHLEVELEDLAATLRRSGLDAG